MKNTQRKAKILTQEMLDEKVQKHQTWSSSILGYLLGKQLSLSEYEEDNVTRYYKGNQLIFPKEISYENVPFTGSIFTNSNFNSLKLEDKNFNNCDLSGSSFTDSKLKFSTFCKTNLTGVNFKNANLGETDLTEANLTNANLTNANFKKADLEKTNCTGANFTNASITKASLEKTNCTGANFTNANFKNTKLIEANFEKALLLNTSVRLEKLSTAIFETCFVDKNTLEYFGLKSKNIQSLNSTFFSITKSKDNTFTIKPLTRRELAEKITDNESLTHETKISIKNMLFNYKTETSHFLQIKNLTEKNEPSEKKNIVVVQGFNIELQSRVNEIKINQENFSPDIKFIFK
jgi:uncharacterized protein YjbI with pentapeptide repeats